MSESKYEKLIAIQDEILDDSDYYPIKNEDTGREDSSGLGNSGCLKLAAEFDYTHRIVDEKCVERGEYVRYEFTVEILDKDGRVLAQDVGSCDSAERPEYSKHNLRAFAKTRAWQRGIKSAAKVKDRLASDLTPSETAGSAEPKPASPSSPPAEPTGPECSCDIKDVKEPYRNGNGGFVCGNCKQQIPKKKRMMFLSANS